MPWLWLLWQQRLLRWLLVQLLWLLWMPVLLALLAVLALAGPIKPAAGLVYELTQGGLSGGRATERPRLEPPGGADGCRPVACDADPPKRR